MKLRLAFFLTAVLLIPIAISAVSFNEAAAYELPAVTSEPQLRVVPQSVGQSPPESEVEVAPTRPPFEAGLVTRVTVPGVLDNQVVQSGQRAPSGDLIGQYSVAAQHDSIGLLAHNYLEGEKFYSLEPGMRVYLETDPGGMLVYEVRQIMRFQATDPNDYSKPFIDEQGNLVSPWELFQLAYLPGGLTFQTCLWGEGSSTWGVMFVQAELVDSATQSSQ